MVARSMTFEDYKARILSTKSLNEGQIKFLIYPFITSVFWAYKRKYNQPKVNLKNWIDTKHPQLNLFKN